MVEVEEVVLIQNVYTLRVPDLVSLAEADYELISYTTLQVSSKGRRFAKAASESGLGPP